MRKFLLKWKQYFIYAGIFSFFCSMLQLTFAAYMLLIYDRVLSSHSVPTLVAITVMAAAALTVMVLLDIARSRLLVRLGIELDRTLSKDVFTQMIKSASFRLQEGSPAKLKDVGTLRNYLSGQAIYFFFDIPWVPICMVIIYLLHPWLGYVAIGGGLIVFVFGVLTDRLSRPHLEKASLIAGQSGDLVGLSVRNAEAVRSMGMIGNVSNRWEVLNNMVMNLQTEASHRAGILLSTSRGIRLFLQVAIFGVGAYLVLLGKATPGIIITASIIMGRALSPIDQAMSTFRQSVDAWGAYNRLNMQFSVPRLPDPMDLPTPSGNISCEAVSFQRDRKMTLYNITLALNAGESLGIIGPSAAGKSTLCRLLVGIWPATSGKVRLDGADIYSWDQEKLGEYIGYLPQDVELFGGSVAENIARLGEIDSERVVEAAMLAGAHELILRLPNGYETQIGSAGSALSGGQRQRVGLARALYGSPVLLVLDEPSSNLDDEGESALLHAIAQMKQRGVTVVIVSHKPSTLASLDKILVLKDGQMAIFGPRDEVFKKIMPAVTQQQMQRPQVSGATLALQQR